MDTKCESQESKREGMFAVGEASIIKKGTFTPDQNQNIPLKHQIGSPASQSSPLHDPIEPAPKRCKNSQETAPLPKIKTSESKDVTDVVIEICQVLCEVCRTKPSFLPQLFGCKAGHFVCERCRIAGGVLLSCPKCYDHDLNVRLFELEDKMYSSECSFKVKGCKQKLSEDFREYHESECEYRLVQCPNRLFAKSCDFSDIFKNIKDHGRTEHSLNKSVTKLDEGLITCKMMHSKDGKSAETLYHERARFPPLEMEFDEKLFYCYYERKHSRGLWFFFIRLYGSEMTAKQYDCEIHLGFGDSNKNDISNAVRSSKVECLHYSVARDEIEGSGNCMTVDDAAVKKLNSGMSLFRVWWKISKKEREA